MFITFNFVSICWVFFYQNELDRVFAVFYRIVIFSIEGDGFYLFVIPAILFGFFIQIVWNKIRTLFILYALNLHWVIFSILIGCGAVLIMAMGPDGVLPFIYFGF